MPICLRNIILKAHIQKDNNITFAHMTHDVKCPDKTEKMTKGSLIRVQYTNKKLQGDDHKYLKN
jgi:hypothetical protein